MQPYNPNVQDATKRPFIVIIQDDWMLQVALRFSPHNAWAVDITLKMNVFGLPLYGGVLPNQHGVGLPIWFMICTNDPGTQQEGIAFEVTFRVIFSRLQNCRPNAIVIETSPHKSFMPF